MTAVQNWLPKDLVTPTIVRNVIRDVLRDLHKMTQRDDEPSGGPQLMGRGLERC
ncbi:hypothetical protein [Mycolicibacterium duvalii]|uniref:Uncharacterized protein n=1 Tax=Mycolicibacterium duvalii TaxID=39688 RepID=A0A7I7JZP9_9MYCO|nr:hypothetical protein [Mycolicibacterium duvalii]MCV7366725.1 hypothetical protein [Mycolicibacterium duvalii]BBX16814.1 hypothetical protein MDUV_16740 [Mycolicibacterium duvalii]